MHLAKQTLIVACTFSMASSLFTLQVKAEDLPGWNKFLFGSTRQDVSKLANGTAVNMSDGRMSIVGFDLAGIRVRADFYFDQLSAGESPNRRFNDITSDGKLTKIEISGTNQTKTCADYEPQVRDSLQARYGEFFEKSVQQKINTNPSFGPQVSDPHFLMTYDLYRSFDNNTFIFAKLESSSYGSSQGDIAVCNLKLTYAVKPASSPAPPQLPAQGF